LLIIAAVAGLAWTTGLLQFAGPVDENEAAAANAAASYEAAIADPASGPSAIDYDRIDRRLKQLMERPTMVGLAVGIVENGQIRFLQGYGETIAGGGDRVTVDTVFRWASLSKGVAGDMVALFAHENRLSLRDPLNRWSSTLRLPGGAEASATVADLLSHQLGLFGHAQDSKLEDNLDPRILRLQLSTLNSICPPGQCHAYQNVAFDAASEIVERLTGRPYRDVVRERLFLPLGMSSASMTRAELLAARSWARPHTGGRNSRPVEVTEPYYRVPAAGGVNSSIKDLALWMRAQMGLVPEVLPQAMLATVQTPRVPTPVENRRRRRQAERIGNSAYGLGWRIYDYAGHRVIGHRGGVRGYRSLILFDPARRSGVVALWNSSAVQPGGIEFEVMDMVYGLPFRDWLELDRAGDSPPVEEPTEANETASPDEAG
jgi:beta-lactamase class C